MLGQFCDLYLHWCEDNTETMHLNAVIGQKIEVDFTRKTFELIDPATGEIVTIIAFVAVLPYFQYV